MDINFNSSLYEKIKKLQLPENVTNLFMKGGLSNLLLQKVDWNSFNNNEVMEILNIAKETDMFIFKILLTLSDLQNNTYEKKN